MGASVSHALPIPPPPPAMGLPSDQEGGGSPLGLQQLLPGMADHKKNDDDGEGSEKTGKLPCPVKYEEVHREAYYSLKPDYFEGFRFDFTKSLNQKFALTHSVYMGSVEVPSQPQCIKVPAGTYEFGANVLDPKMMLVGRILTDGRMSARIKYDLNDFVSFKLNGLLTNEPHFSQAVCDIDLKGSSFQSQLKLGNNAFYGANYIQSVTPHLALGGEAFWIGRQRKWGYAFAGRHATDKAFSVAQIASTGGISLTYAQKVSEKVTLATEFMFNRQSRECSASVGYDCLLRQCRLRGRLDTNGVVSAFLEERMNVGVTFVLSAEIDHWKKDYRFGFGMIVGE